MSTLWVALAGAAGAVTRYRIGQAVGVRTFPWATLGINIIGCFVLAALASGPATRWSPTVSVALTVGFLGAFTTFSTFGYETVTLARTDRAGLAVLYVALSLAGGLGASALGYLAGRA